MPAAQTWLYRRGASPGFTMLELVVVVSLLTLFTMMIVPLYGYSMSRMESRSSRNNLTALIDFVQQRAVVESREFRIYFDEEERAFWVMALAGMNEDEPWFDHVTEHYGRRQHLPNHLEFTALPRRRDRELEAQYLAFYPNGASDRAVIRVADERGGDAGYTIEVMGALGKTELTYQ